MTASRIARPTDRRLRALGALWLALAGCAKSVRGGCASDADCPEGVRCDRAARRCMTPDAIAGDSGTGDGGRIACAGAVAGQDDPACGAIDCDELDDACKDYADLVAGRCAGDGVCKTPNDPLTCLDPADRCFPYSCDDSGADPVCRTRCDGPSDCADGGDCPAGRCCQGTWELHPIDTPGDVGTWIRITTDAAGNAHAAWLDEGLYRVRTGSNTPADRGAWANETVPPPNPAFFYGGSLLSLDIDDAGTRHLLYYDENTGDAVYGADDGMGWTSTTITMGAGWFRGALAVSGAGLASIVVADATTRQFQYQGAAVGSCTGVAAGSVLHAMAVDAAGRAHFIEWDDATRYYAQSEACDPENPTLIDCCAFDDVAVTTVDPGEGDPTARNSLAVDPTTGEAHLTFYRGQSGDLFHAVCDRTACVTEFVDSSGDAGRYSAIVVGAAGLHVAYHVPSTGNLRYATNASGTWRTFPLDETGMVGEYASLARGPDGRLHAAYYDAVGKDALYATLAPECVPGE